MTATGQRSSTCRRKGSESDKPKDYGAGSTFRIDDFFEPWKVAVFFVALLLVFFSLPIMRATERCFCRAPTGMNTIFVDPLPEATGFPEMPLDSPDDKLRVAAGGPQEIIAEPPVLDNAFGAAGAPDSPPPAAQQQHLPGSTGETLQ